MSVRPDKGVFVIQRVPVIDRLARAVRDGPWGYSAALHPKAIPCPAMPSVGQAAWVRKVSEREGYHGATGTCRRRPHAPVRAALPPKRA